MSARLRLEIALQVAFKQLLVRRPDLHNVFATARREDFNETALVRADTLHGIAQPRGVAIGRVQHGGQHEVAEVGLELQLLRMALGREGRER